MISYDNIVEKIGKRKLNPYLIYKTLRGIEEGKSKNQAWFDAVEDENYYGIRPDIVEDRKKHAEFLNKIYKIKINDTVVLQHLHPNNLSIARLLRH